MSELRETRVSVIIPLVHHRGLARACVESWTRNQTYSRSNYEVIVVSDGSDPALAQDLRGLLGPNDQLLHHPTTNEPHLCDVGARRAQGQLLVLTESHCWADADCLEQLITFFRTHDYHGACSNFLGITPNYLARLDEWSCRRGVRAAITGTDCRTVIRHCFAILRDAYLQVGGFVPRYGRFAERALGAALRERGYRLGYAQAARVSHAFRDNFGELWQFLGTSIPGEYAHHRDHSPAYCARYFDAAAEWTAPRFDRATNRALFRAALCSLVLGTATPQRVSLWRALGKALVRSLPTVLAGTLGCRLTWETALQIAKFRCWLWRHDEHRSKRAYADAWELMARLRRLEYLTQQPQPGQDQANGEGHWEMADLSPENLLGFHGMENWQSRSFRWTRAVFVLHLPLGEGASVMRLDTGGLRSQGSNPCLRVFVNGHRLPSTSVCWEDQGVAVRIDRSHLVAKPTQQLIFTCDPLRPSEQGVPDSRELGLPIFSIDLEPLPDTTTRIAGQGQARVQQPAPMS